MDSKNKKAIQEIDENELFKHECPFTWNKNGLEERPDLKFYGLPIHDESFPLELTMHDITTAYVHLKMNEDHFIILRNLEKWNDFLSTFEKKDLDISFEIILYILQTMKCFIFLKLGKKEDLKNIYAEIKNVKIIDKKERSILNACKSYFWLKYQKSNSDEPENLIRKAIDENCNCAFYYFVLAKILRHKRKYGSTTSEPSDQEIDCFSNAYLMSNKLIYKVFLAQLWREKKDYDKASELYEEIFQADSQSCTVLLRTALGFIQLKKFDRAKICLDKAKEIDSSRKMYLQFQGLYFFKQENFKEALPYFEKAKDLELNDLTAELQYARCKAETEKSFDLTSYLVKLINTSSRICPGNQTQFLIIEVAFSFWKRDNNIEEALKYFLEAIEMDPKSKGLEKFYSNFFKIHRNGFRANIFIILKNELLSTLFYQRNRCSSNAIEIAKRVRRYCEEYFSSRFISFQRY